MTRTLFWISLLFILYTYAGYPALLHFWSILLPKKVRKKPLADAPLVSVVLAARNEERNIARRIENLLEQDYPADRMEIIVVSDGSTDATDSIVGALVEGRGKAAPSLRHIPLENNRGKPGALNAGIAAAAGEYIIFADARQQFEPDAISRLVENFSDHDVGAVSGELVFHADSGTAIRADMGLYWDLEKWIRKTESRIHSTAGATGAIYAARKELVPPLPPDVILDDVMIPMRIVLRGYRTVFETGAVAWDTVSRDHTHEKRRKVRTLFGNYQLLRMMPGLLSPRENPIFLQFLSHKIFRLFVPLFFILMMASALAAGGAAYTIFFAAALAAVLLPLIEKPLAGIPLMRKACSFSRTFTSLNYFAFLAFLMLFKPGRREVW